MGRIRRTLTAAFLAGMVGTLLSCSSWRSLEVPPAEYLAERPRATLRVTTREAGEITLNDPLVVGDSLVARGSEDRTVKVPLASISDAKARYTNVPETALLTAFAISAAFLLLVIP